MTAVQVSMPPGFRLAGFRLVVPGAPVPKGRPRMTRTGRAYTPPTTRRYETRVQAAWAAAGRLRLPDGPFAAAAELVIARPASHYRTKARLLRDDAPALPLRLDADNALKALLDALNGLAFPDDRWAADVRARKRWAADGEPERAELDLRAL